MEFSQAKNAARKRSLILIAAGTLGFLVLALWFTTLSSFSDVSDQGLIAEATSVNKNSDQTLEDCQNPSSSTPQCIARRESLSVWADVDNLVTTLESKHVKKWGAIEFAVVSEEFKETQALFESNQFQSALAGFQSVLGNFQNLDRSSQMVLEDAIARGWMAINDERADIALDSFELALLIDPQNSSAISGQDRALVLDDVLDFYSRGSNADQEGSLDTALSLFQRAQQLDSENEKVMRAVQVTQQKINARNYRTNMSNGLIAIENDDLTQARKAFQNALSLKPGSLEALNGIAQTDILLERKGIGSLLAQAMQANKNEDWEATSRFYGKVLALDPTVKQAIDGKYAVDQMIGLETEVVGLLERQHRMSSIAVFDYAVDIVAEAENRFSSSRRLNERINELKFVMAAMKVPVKLMVRSDNKTNINIQRIGNLGVFDERIFDTLPGKYVVTGSRRGFRDKRIEIDVLPRSGKQVVTVICDEPVR